MRKILLAFDGGEPARRALALAAEVAQRFGASVTVVSVVPVHAGPSAVDPWDDSTAHAEQLRLAQHLLHERGIEPELVETAGDPARTIERIAEEGAFDVIVVGSRGVGTIGRMLQQSVSEHVATHAPTSVLVVR